MSTPLNELPARSADSGLFNVVVDTPRRSRSKYKFDEEHGIWRLIKNLPLGAVFPFNFGFIPSTRGEDGDPLDALVIGDEPAFVGCVLPVRLIGVIEAEQTERRRTVRNDRLIGVVETPYNPAPFHFLDELGDQRLSEIEHFFISYNQIEGRIFRVLGRQGRQRAQSLVDAALVATSSLIR